MLLRARSFNAHDGCDGCCACYVLPFTKRISPKRISKAHLFLKQWVCEMLPVFHNCHWRTHYIASIFLFISEEQLWKIERLFRYTNHMFLHAWKGYQENCLFLAGHFKHTRLECGAKKECVVPMCSDGRICMTGDPFLLERYKVKKDHMLNGNIFTYRFPRMCVAF